MTFFVTLVTLFSHKDGGKLKLDYLTVFMNSWLVCTGGFSRLCFFI